MDILENTTREGEVSINQYKIILNSQSNPLYTCYLSGIQIFFNIKFQSGTTLQYRNIDWNSLDFVVLVLQAVVSSSHQNPIP